MFCKYCGTENKDGAVFCKACGRQMVARPSNNNKEQIRHEELNTQVNSRTGMKPMVLLGYVAAVAVTVTCMIVAVRVLKPNDDNTREVAQTENAKQQEPVAPVAAPTNEDAPEASEVTEEPADEDAATPEDEAIPEGVETFDPFDGIEVWFEGYAGKGIARLKVGSDEPAAMELDYEFDREEDLDNGDQITLWAGNFRIRDFEDYLLERYGKIPYPTQKKFYVEGLPSYDDLPGGEGIIFPDSSVRTLMNGEIHFLSDEDLHSAINELYARNGYIFPDETLRAYYERFDWYEPLIPADAFQQSEFSEIELKNLQQMQTERNSR